MNLRFSLILFLSCALNLKAVSQDGLVRYKLLADELYTGANYTSAIEVYERLLYFGDNTYSNQIYLPLARAYSALGKYEEASVHYINAYNSQKVDTIKYDILFESSLNYILAGDTALAYSQLLNIPETKISERVSNKLHLLMGTLDYKSGRYTTAKNHFLAITLLDSMDKKDIKTFFKKTYKKNRRYNPYTVRWMSIIPGLGQAWCGNYKESANAFLLTGALVFLYVDVSLKYTVVDGLLVVFPWLNRYYRGGISKSFDLAKKKRETEKNKLYNKLLRTLPSIK